MNHGRTCRVSIMVTAVLLVTSACAQASNPDMPSSLGSSTEGELGSISGAILYESEDPGLRVYIREMSTGHVQWVSPNQGGRSFSIADLPPGTYVVVGWFYALGASGAYTSLDIVVAEGAEQMRACEEAIVEIELQPGEAYTGADIGCWGGDFFSLVE